MSRYNISCQLLETDRRVLAHIEFTRVYKPLRYSPLDGSSTKILPAFVPLLLLWSSCLGKDRPDKGHHRQTDYLRKMKMVSSSALKDLHLRRGQSRSSRFGSCNLHQIKDQGRHVLEEELPLWMGS